MGESVNNSNTNYWPSPKQTGSNGSDTLVVRKATITGAGTNITLGGSDKVVTNVTLKDGSDYQTLTIDTSEVYRKFGFTAIGKQEVQLGSISLASMDTSVATVSGNKITPAHQNKFGSTVVIITASRNENGINHDYRSMIRVSTTTSDGIASPKIAAGQEHMVALRTDGTVWAWGRGTEGQIGNGAWTNVYYPYQVLTDSTAGTTLSNIIDIAASEYASFAVDTDGYVWSWGGDGNYQLGRNYSDNIERTVAAKVEGIDEKIVEVEAGTDNVFALGESGRVWVWGHGGYGLNADEKFQNPTVRQPHLVYGGESGSHYLEDVVSISASYGDAYAVKANGTAWVWGLNSNGQLGNGNYAGYSFPIRVKTGEQGSSTGYMERVIELTGQATNNVGVTYAVTDDNMLYGWGYTTTYVLGGESKNGINYNTPILVNTNVSKVAASGTNHDNNYTYILKTNGKINSIGYDGNSELGNGIRVQVNDDSSTTQYPNETQSTWQEVVGLTDMMQIDASMWGWYGAAIKKDGTIWVWGYNNYGQLGTGYPTGESINYGSTNYWPTPKQVGSESSNTLVVRGASVSGAGTNVNYGGTDAIVSNVTLKDTTSGSNFQTLTIDTDKVYRKLGFTLTGKSEVVLGSSISLTSMDTDIVTVGTNTIVPAHKGKYGTTVVLITGSRSENGITHTYKGMIRVGTTPSDGIATPRISLGAENVVVLKKDGTVWTWGRGTEGQLGNGGWNNIFSPTQVITDSGSSTPLSNIIDIAASQTEAYAVDKDGNVWSWGQDGNGELGRSYSDNNERTVAAKVEGITEKVVEVEAGTDNAFALGESGRVWAWGYGNLGLLADPDYNNGTRSTPKMVVGGESGSHYLEDIVSISASYGDAYAIKANGTAWVWGLNAYGQMGNGNTTGYSVPVQVKTGAQGSSTGYLEDVIELTGQATNNIGVTYAVTKDKKLYGWGYTSTNVLGGESTNNIYYRTPILVTTGVNKVSASGQGNGNNYTYILKTDNKVYGIGQDGNGELGDNDEDRSNNTTWTPVYGMESVLQVDASMWGWFGAAIKTDGTVWTWGYNNYGQLGIGSTSGEYYSDTGHSHWKRPMQAGGSSSNVLAVRGASIQSSAGGSTDIGGDNVFISNVTLHDYYQPALAFDRLVIDGDGIYRKMAFSTLSDGEKAVDSVTITSMDTDVVTVSGRVITPSHKGKYGSTVLLIKSTTTDLGITTTYKGMIRVKTAPSGEVASPMVAAGSNYMVALKKDGTVWTWGYNVNGELGIGYQNSNSDYRRGVYYPVQVLAGEQPSSTGYLHDIIQVTAGSNFSAALAKTGEVYLWGWNDNYQFGIDSDGNARPNSTAFSTPVKMNTTEIHDIVQIDAGYYNMMVLRNDGSVWSWGHNGYGVLGNGNGDNQYMPQRVLGGEAGGDYMSDIVQISSAYFHSMALKANGTVYAWGGSQFGQLGNGSSGGWRSWPWYNYPVQVLFGKYSSN